MQMIRMLRDWTLAEDANGFHVLMEGNTFAVSDDDAERAVDEDGAAEYVGTRPSKKGVPAVVDGIHVEPAHAEGTAIGTPTDAPSAAGDAAAIPATGGTTGGEPSPNTAPVKGKATKTGEDAPA